MRKNFQIAFISIFVFMSVALISIVIKGSKSADGLDYQSIYKGDLTGPFESSGSNSRYALTESIVKNKSFYFDETLARLASPDLVHSDGKYFSIFTPGVSFAVVPFYLIGSQIGIPQLMTYLATAIVAIFNTILVAIISKRLGASIISSFLSGFIFLFGSNALTYALTLTQHHWSILVILLTILLMLKSPSATRNIFLGILYGVGLLIDLPNAIILLPLILYTSWQHFAINQTSAKLKVNLIIVYMALGLLPLLGLYGLYNHEVTGSYYKLGQFLGRANYPPSTEELSSINAPDPYQPTLPFYPRLQVNGLYTLLISDERGWLYYSPFVFIGLLGLLLAMKRNENKDFVLVMLSMVTITILLYASFGDPWGGWAFGPRYLLPATALLATGLGVAIEKWKKSIFFSIIFLTTVGYSISVSAYGAFTTTQVPPKQEADRLSTFIPYTYLYNQQLVVKNQTSSLAYNLWLRDSIPLAVVVKTYIGIGMSIALICYLLNLNSSRLKNRKL